MSWIVFFCLKTFAKKNSRATPKFIGIWTRKMIFLNNSRNWKIIRNFLRYSPTTLIFKSQNLHSFKKEIEKKVEHFHNIFQGFEPIPSCTSDDKAVRIISILIILYFVVTG